MFGNSKKDMRFVIVFSQTPSMGTHTHIIKDTKTGVLYLERSTGHGVTMIPLRDSEGQIMIESIDE